MQKMTCVIIELNSEFVLLKIKLYRVRENPMTQLQLVEERSINVNKNTDINSRNLTIFLRRLKYFKSVEVY